MYGFAVIMKIARRTTIRNIDRIVHPLIHQNSGSLILQLIFLGEKLAQDRTFS